MLNVRETRHYLKESEFKPLFTQVLGWNYHTQTLNITVDETEYELTAIAEKRGMVVFECAATETEGIPDYATRRKIQNRSQNLSTSTLSFIPMPRKPHRSGSGQTRTGKTRRLP